MLNLSNSILTFLATEDFGGQPFPKSQVHGMHLTPWDLDTCTFKNMNDSPADPYHKRHSLDNPERPSSSLAYQAWLTNDVGGKTLFPTQEFTVWTLSYQAISLDVFCFKTTQDTFWSAIWAFEEGCKRKIPYFLSLSQILGDDRKKRLRV